MTRTVETVEEADPSGLKAAKAHHRAVRRTNRSTTNVDIRHLIGTADRVLRPVLRNVKILLHTVHTWRRVRSQHQRQ